MRERETLAALSPAEFLSGRVNGGLVLLYCITPDQLPKLVYAAVLTAIKCSSPER